VTWRATGRQAGNEIDALVTQQRRAWKWIICVSLSRHPVGASFSVIGAVLQSTRDPPKPGGGCKAGEGRTIISPDRPASASSFRSLRILAPMKSLARVCSSQLPGQGSICPLPNCTQELKMTEQRTRTGGAQRGRGGMPWERPVSLCVQTKIPDRLVETAFGFKIPVTWHCHRHHSRH
jgi:hypothetical protein